MDLSRDIENNLACQIIKRIVLLSLVFGNFWMF